MDRWADPVGLLRINNHCLFTWRERGSRRLVEVGPEHCEDCRTEAERRGFGLELRGTQRPARDKLVLVVDDDDDLRQTVCQIFDESGYRVYAAADGREALELLGRIPTPSLILLDLHMPRMDGRAFLDALQANPRLSQVPVVVLTGRTVTELSQRVEVVPKPVRTRSLLRIVEAKLAG